MKVFRPSLVVAVAAALIVSGFFVFNVFAANSGDVVINEFSSASNPEWVELRNTTASPIDLTGWRLTELTTPQGTPAEVDLLSLSGIIPAGGVLAFDVDGLNNPGDSIGLFDELNNEIDRVTYGTVTGFTATAGLETEPSSGQSAVFDGTNWAITSSLTKIISADPVEVSGDFTPQVGSTLARSSEAYLGRTTTYIGPQTGLGNPETIKWKVTISHETAVLNDDMVDLDEVGWTDQTDFSLPSDVFHYPFTEEVSGNLVALGSCDDTVDVTGHVSACDALIGFSLVENDIFTNADKIKFNSSAPIGLYTITYELVNTADDAVLGMYEVMVEVASEVTITSKDPSEVDISFEPALNDGDDIARGDTEYLGRRTVNETDSELGTPDDTIKWKVTVSHETDALIDDMVDLDEVGWEDQNDFSTLAFHYPLAADVSGNLVATGSCDLELPSGHEGGDPCTINVGFSVDADDDFINADSITFSLNAPNGTYTIKYELVNTNGDVVLGMHEVMVEVVDPVVIVFADPADVDDSFVPAIEDGDSLDRNAEAYLGRTTAYTGPVLGADPDTIKWKVTIDGPTGLVPNMVDLDEVGFDDPDGDEINIATFHYPFQTVDADTIQATGSCETEDTHDNGCTTDAFSLDENDVFTNADKVMFNSNAPLGTYTITYELVDTASGEVVLSNAYAVSVNVDFDKTIALTSAGQWALVSAPTLLGEAPTVTDDEDDAVALLVYENGVFVAPGPGNGEIIKPVSAFFVKTTNTGKVGFRYADISSPTQTSKQLSAGWNLVGTNNDGLAVNEFSSIQNTSQTAGMVTLFVPDTYNSRKDTGYTSWGEDANHDLNANPITALPDNDLSAYDGYWVFMDAAKAFVKNL